MKRATTRERYSAAWKPAQACCRPQTGERRCPATCKASRCAGTALAIDCTRGRAALPVDQTQTPYSSLSPPSNTTCTRGPALRGHVAVLQCRQGHVLLGHANQGYLFSENDWDACRNPMQSNHMQATQSSRKMTSHRCQPLRCHMLPKGYLLPTHWHGE